MPKLGERTEEAFCGGVHFLYSTMRVTVRGKKEKRHSSSLRRGWGGGDDERQGSEGLAGASAKAPSLYILLDISQRAHRRVRRGGEDCQIWRNEQRSLVRQEITQTWVWTSFIQTIGPQLLYGLPVDICVHQVSLTKIFPQIFLTGDISICYSKYSWLLKKPSVLCDQIVTIGKLWARLRTSADKSAIYELPLAVGSLGSNNRNERDKRDLDTFLFINSSRSRPRSHRSAMSQGTLDCGPRLVCVYVTIVESHVISQGFDVWMSVEIFFYVASLIWNYELFVV